MSRRNGRIALNLRPWMAWPMNTTGPFDEISRRMARPSVVLPEPDSPTTPSVSPLRTSIADAVHRLDVADHLAQHAALDREPDLEVVGRDHDRRLRARRRRVRLRLGGEQRARVRMLGRREHALDRALLDDLAALHDADSVGELAHDAEIVGDEQHRHAEPRLRVLQQLQDLRLHGDVERGGRLVGDQQVRARWPAPWRS